MRGLFVMDITVSSLQSKHQPLRSKTLRLPDDKMEYFPLFLTTQACTHTHTHIHAHTHAHKGDLKGQVKG